MTDGNKILIITPTYNEIENIQVFIDAVLLLNLDLLLVDDNSPDGTAQKVKESPMYNKKIFLIERSHKMGLGSAYREGFYWFMQSKYTHCIEMDVDQSHTFKDLKKIISNLNHNDMVIGSRYISGGGSIGWSIKRRMLSKYANLTAKYLLKSKINDLTSGFRSFNKKSLNVIDYKNLTSNGYSFQIETAFMAENANLKILEVPITFEERSFGQSKMDFRIKIEALNLLLKLYIKKKNSNHPK